MRDLTDVLGAAVEARAQELGGLAPAPGLAGLRTRVRRRRAVRHTVEAVAVLPVVAAIGVGGWLLLGDRDPVPPVVSPTPTVEPTPGPSRTPRPTPTLSPTSTPEVVLGDLIEEPGFPPYYAMPDGLLDGVGPGWVLATYAPRVYGEAPSAELFLVIAPDGTRYASARIDVDVSEVPEGQSWVEHEPVTWDGSGLAVVREVTHLLGQGYESLDEGETLAFDLAVGSVVGPTAVTPSSTGASWRAEGPGGRVVVGEPYSDRFTLDPDGAVRSNVRYGVDGRVCSAIGWLDVSTLLALCVVDDEALDADGDGWPEGVRSHDPALFRVPVDGGLPQRAADVDADDPLPGGFAGVWVRDGVVAFAAGAEGPSACWAAVAAWIDGEYRIVQRADSGGAVGVDAHGGVVYVASSQSCHDETPMALTRHDLSTGASVDLVPVPQGAWLRTLTGWVVAE